MIDATPSGTTLTNTPFSSSGGSFSSICAAVMPHEALLSAAGDLGIGIASWITALARGVALAWRQGCEGRLGGADVGHLLHAGEILVVDGQRAEGRPPPGIVFDPSAPATVSELVGGDPYSQANAGRSPGR